MKYFDALQKIHLGPTVSIPNSIFGHFEDYL